MPTVRTVALAIALASLASSPARAETCSLTVEGRSILDDEPCRTTRRGGTLTVERGGLVAAQVRRSILTARIADAPGPPARGGKPRGPRSFGRIVTSDDHDEKVCYFNQKATLCVAE